MSKAVPRFRRFNPPLPAATGYVMQVLISGLIEGQRWVMDFGYMGVGAVPPTNAESTIAASWATLNGAAWQGTTVPTVSLDSIKVSCVTSPTRNPFTLVNAAPLPLVGNNSGDHYPSTVAAVISKYTLTKGQHGRGRNYTAGVPLSHVTTNVDPNALNAAGLADLFSFATALENNDPSDGTNSVELCIYTRPPKGLPVTLSSLVNQVIARPLLGTIRRRRVGRGK